MVTDAEKPISKNTSIKEKQQVYISIFIDTSNDIVIGGGSNIVISKN
jgi:hypothetical protein